MNKAPKGVLFKNRRDGYYRKSQNLHGHILQMLTVTSVRDTFPAAGTG